MTFTGKRAVVTGAGGGIGAAVVDLLRERGADVVGCDLVGAAVTADLATTDGRAALAEAAGTCDHLVLAHGIVRPKPIEETTEEDWDAILSVNAKSFYFLCRLFGPLLRDAPQRVLTGERHADRVTVNGEQLDLAVGRVGEVIDDQHRERVWEASGIGHDACGKSRGGRQLGYAG